MANYYFNIFIIIIMKKKTLDEYFKNFPSFSPFHRSASMSKLPNFLKNNPFVKRALNIKKKLKKEDSKSK